MKEHLKLLGHKVHDPVTQITGIVQSVCFDLSGCIQGCVRQEPREGKVGESYWIDVKQLVIQSQNPVCNPPDFAAIAPGEEKGCQMKPAK